MADISKIKALNGTTYNIKDATARSDVANKLNTNQGVENAGKFMVVNSQGNIEPVSMTAWQGGSY